MFIILQYLDRNEPATVESQPNTAATEPTENISDVVESMEFESIDEENMDG